MSYEVRDAQSLARLDLAVHSARFSIENLHYDGDEQVATLAFDHMLGHEFIAERRRRFLWMLRAPVRTFRLTFAAITDLSVEDRAQVGWYEIDDLSWKAGVLRLEAVPPLVVSMTCPSPLVRLDVSEEIVDWSEHPRLAVRRPSSDDPLSSLSRPAS